MKFVASKKGPKVEKHDHYEVEPDVLQCMSSDGEEYISLRFEDVNDKFSTYWKVMMTPKEAMELWLKLGEMPF